MSATPSLSDMFWTTLADAEADIVAPFSALSPEAWDSGIVTNADNTDTAASQTVLNTLASSVFPSGTTVIVVLVLVVVGLLIIAYLARETLG